MRTRFAIFVPVVEENTFLRVLRGCSIQRSIDVDLEVVIVQHDGLMVDPEEVRRYFPRLPFRLEGEIRNSLQQAMNEGIRKTKCDYVLLLGPGLIPAPDLVASHWRVHKECGERPKAVVGPVEIQDAAGLPGLKTYLQFQDPLQGLPSPTFADLSAWVCTSQNLSIREEILLSVGGIGPWFGLTRDPDLGIRLIRNGVQIAACPKGLVRWHRTPDLSILKTIWEEEGRLEIRISEICPEGLPLVLLKDEVYAAFLPFNEEDVEKWSNLATRLEKFPEEKQIVLSLDGGPISTGCRPVLDWLYERIHRYWKGRGMYRALVEKEGEGWVASFVQSTGILDDRRYHGRRIPKQGSCELTDGKAPVLFSVVIPVRNGKETIQATLESFFRQTIQPDRLEIIVVDDGSTDGTQDVVRKIQGLCRLKFLQQEARGQAAATNRGIESAEGEFVLLSAADIVAKEDLLERHLLAHQKEEDEVAILGYLPYDPEIEITPFMEYIVKEGTQFGYNLIADRSKVSPKFTYAPNISVRTSVLKDIGGFDEAFVFGMQDIELGVRLRRHGVRLVFDETAVGFHRHPVTLERFLNYRQPMAGKGAVLFSRKWPDISPMALLKARCYEKFWIWKGWKSLHERIMELVLQLEKIPPEDRPVLVSLRRATEEKVSVLHYFYDFLLKYHFYRGVAEELCAQEGPQWMERFLENAGLLLKIFPHIELKKMERILHQTDRVLKEGIHVLPLLVFQTKNTRIEIEYDPCFGLRTPKEFNFFAESLKDKVRDITKFRDERSYISLSEPIHEGVSSAILQEGKYKRIQIWRDASNEAAWRILKDSTGEVRSKGCQPQLQVKASLFEPPYQPAIAMVLEFQTSQDHKDGVLLFEDLSQKTRYEISVPPSKLSRSPVRRKILLIVQLPEKTGPNVRIVLVSPGPGPTVLGWLRLEKGMWWRLLPAPHSPLQISRPADGTERVFFVGGTAKSGTTWVEKILNSHPEVLCLGQGNFYDYFRIRDSIIDKLQQQRNIDFVYWTLPKVSLEMEVDRIFTANARALWGFFSHLWGQVLIGDRSPDNAMYLHRFLRAFPDSVYLHCVRHPLDVVISRIHHEWCLFRDGKKGLYVIDEKILQDVEKGIRANDCKKIGEVVARDEILSFFLKEWIQMQELFLSIGPLFPGRTMVIRYEDLLDRPVKEFERIFDFLKVDVCPLLLERIHAATSFERLSGGRKNGDEDRDSFFRKGIAGDYRNYFWPETIEAARRILGDLPDRFGYRLSLEDEIKIDSPRLMSIQNC